MGPLVLTGDAAHFQDNFENRRVPAFNFNKEQSVASMNKIAAVAAKEGARIWINHDARQSASYPHAPEFMD